jgi:phytoene desaturase
MTRDDPRLAKLIPDSRAPKAVVVGAGLGGLAAAMRLGAKGYRVTVIDKLDTPGGRGSAIWRDGHRFDLGPTIITVPYVFRDLWKACGRDFDAEVDLRAMDPFYEIRWPDGSSFRMNQDKDFVRSEVTKLSPADADGYDRFLKDAEARYTFGFEGLGRKPMNKLWDLLKEIPGFVRLRADRSVAAHAAMRFKDPRLQMAFSFHPLFIGGDPFRVTSIYALVSHLEHAFGVHYAMGGVAAIAQAMVRVIEDQGGLVRLGHEVDEVLIDHSVPKGRARGVRLSSGEIVTADIVVSNADSGHTYDRLLRNHTRKRWTGPRLKRTRWSMGLFVWYFGTRGTKGKWQDVGHHTILNGPRYRGLVDDVFMRGHLAEDMSLYVHRPSITDPSVAPEGDDTFYALSPVPHLGHDNGVDWDEMAEPYRQRVQRVLEDQMLPGLGDHLSASEVFTPNTFRDRYLSPYGAGFSFEPRMFQSAWFRPHNVSEEVKGLYLVGAGTHPGAGVPSVVTSAEVLAQLVPDAELVR